MHRDVIIVGGGVVGCALARELSKYRLKVLLLEKDEDLGTGASKSNSAIIHTGYDATPGTLESKLVVTANPMYGELVKELDIPFHQIGAILPAFSDEQYAALPGIKEKAFRNGIYDVAFLSRERILSMEPNLSPSVKGGLHILRESIIDPFLLVLALAENAVANGAEVLQGKRVTAIGVNGGRACSVTTQQGDTYTADYIINAAGLFNDEIAAMVGKADYKVNPRKGEFYILEKNTSCKVAHIVLPIPAKTTKGKLICPTIHGNTLVGPTAEDLEDKESKSVTHDGLASILDDVRAMVPGVDIRDTITQYAGLRANRVPEGVHIDVFDDLKGYINISGVRSTGVTACVSIAVYTARLLFESGLAANLNTQFHPCRKGIPHFKDLSQAEQESLIARNPKFGNVICRCEAITEGEILAAIHSPIGARSVDGVKRRVRAGMGRCQAGFCGPRVLEILARELGVPMESICKNEPGSEMAVGTVREAGKGATA